MQVSGTDARVVEYVVRCLALESHYLEEAGQPLLASLRFEQARALAAAYGVNAPEQGEIPVVLTLDAWLEEV